MTVAAEIQVACSSQNIPDLSDIDDWIKTALQQIRRGNVELVVRIVDQDEITELNKEYRSKDSVTDVLSFPANLPHIKNPAVLGDVVICADAVQHQAKELGAVGLAHWALVVIHGILHLCGYDHQLPDEAQEMESLENSILLALGFARSEAFS